MANRSLPGEKHDLLHPLGITRQELENWLIAPADINSKQVHALRQKLQISQLHLARLLGVSESAVSLWETGKRKPRGPAQRLLKLIDELSRYTKVF